MHVEPLNGNTWKSQMHFVESAKNCHGNTDAHKQPSVYSTMSL